MTSLILLIVFVLLFFYKYSVFLIRGNPWRLVPDDFSFCSARNRLSEFEQICPSSTQEVP